MKSKMITIRVSEEDWQELVKAAKAEDRNLSSFMIAAGKERIRIISRSRTRALSISTDKETKGS